MWLHQKLALSFDRAWKKATRRQKASTKASPHTARHLPQETAITVAVVGCAHIGKTSLIRQLQRQKQRRHQLRRGATMMFSRRKSSSIFTFDATTASPTLSLSHGFNGSAVPHMTFLEFDSSTFQNNSPNFPEHILSAIQAVLVCYDTTNRDSMDCLPDLLNIFCSREMPCILIGLKTDLTSKCQVDPQLGCDLASLFDVQGMELSALSDTVQVERIYHALVRLTYERTTCLDQTSFEAAENEEHNCPGAEVEETMSTAASARGKGLPSETQYRRHTSPPIRTAVKSLPITPSPPPSPVITKRLSEPIFMNKVPHKSVRSAPSSPQLQRTSRRTTENNAQLRRRKSERRSVAASVVRRGSSRLVNSIRRRRTTPCSPSLNDILDCVLCSEEDPDEPRMIVILVTFFRRFMKPRELVRVLIERFDHDCHGKFPLPTLQQKRIRSLLCFWLSHHWTDFVLVQTRQALVFFLSRMSRRKELQGICDVLMPLAMREAPEARDDPDACWGLTDPVSMRNKKDSGYAESFHPHHQSPDTSSPAPNESRFSLVLTPIFAPHRVESAEFGGLSYLTFSGATKCDEFFSLTDICVAEQLTWLESDMFRKIKPRDFLRYIWSPHNPLSAMLAHARYITSWVTMTIVTQHTRATQTDAIEKFICIAEALRGLANFNTLPAVLTGLQDESVQKSEAWTCVRTDLVALYTRLEQVMRDTNNGERHPKDDDEPSIPHIETALERLLSIESMETDLTDGAINWTKYVRMGTIIDQMMRHQYPPYTSIQLDFSVLCIVAESAA
ncbi:ras guanine nucleotide exchange factor domain-containing protein [Syncephalastrum racemosum]|uniref:Ras guanine nucleotide exchange factor domain-containing protein n=1 Tax=Syncephalastrum racemosum TaxID=13706 RepID=A0A1X2H5V5_SYNRA|nr:ras guanine nucleotide exchange factor domain-containing protein [Syncephalastrum racemosum]